MRYLVAHVVHSPAGAVRSARLVIDDVPDRTTVADVVKALTSAGLTAPERPDPKGQLESWRRGGFSEAGVPLGNYEIKAEGRRGWPASIAGIDEAPRVSWARLTTPPKKGDGRRITVRLSDDEFAQVTLAAQRAGVNLQQWCLSALTSRATAEAVK